MEDFIASMQGGIPTRITFYRQGLVRVRRSLTGNFYPDTAILVPLETRKYYNEELDEFFPAWPCEKPQVSPDGNVFSGFGMELRFDPRGAMTWTDGASTFREVPGRHMLYRERQLIHSFCLDDCLYYGFGEKTGPLEKTGSFLRFSNKDAIGYDPEHTDPLYKHVPFFFKMTPDGKHVCGVFYHTAADCEMDLGREVNGYYPPMGQFFTRQKELDLFLIKGESMADVLYHFAEVTGLPAFPPKYAYGYLGSTMFYTELPRRCDAAICDFVGKAHRLGIPCSNFQLSSGYTTDHMGRRNVFHWNREKFPDPNDFVKAMESCGAPVTPNIKPALLTTNPLYPEFRNYGAFIRHGDGTPVVSRFWGGEGSFVDFTNPKARELWKYHLKKDLIAYGIRSFWNDNNEFDVNEGWCVNEGNPAPATDMRAVLPLLMNKTAWEALEECYPNQRPYLVSRSGCAGIGRYAQVWTGDNKTGWESLKWNIATMLCSSISGMPNTGSDVGGFAGGAPEKELLLRWIACGCVMPRFSIHSANDDNTVTEPWMYESAMPAVKGFFDLRKRLLPLIYSLGYTASCGNSPIWRPMVWQFPEDPRCRKENVDFFLGDGLLCACVVEQGARQRKVWLPQGTVFYDFYTRQRYEGGQEVTLEAPLDKLPLLQKGGSILPTQETDGVHLWVCPEENCSFLYYNDDGMTTNPFAPENDYIYYELTRQENTVTLMTHCQNLPRDHAPVRQVNLQCHHRAPAWVKRGEEEYLPMILDAEAFRHAHIGWHYDPEKKLCRIRGVNQHNLTVSFDTIDLIKMDPK